MERFGPMGKNDYEIMLKNCRNIVDIDGGSILVKKNALNVFYGRNGVGKTTLVRALRYICSGADEAKTALASYRYLESDDSSDEPNVTCATRLRKLLVFDDEWVNTHCFDKSTLHRNAFELYVRDGEIRKLEKQRDGKLGHLRAVLQSNEVDKLNGSLTAMQKGLGKTKTNGGFAANAPTVKAFRNGVPVEVVPECLSHVVAGMTAKEKAEWLDWHVKRPRASQDEVCPYCGTRDSKRMVACEEYDNTRDALSVKQWASIASVYDDVGPRLSRANAALLGRVLRSKKAPTVLEVEAMAAITAEVIEVQKAIDGVAAALIDAKSSDAAFLVTTLRGYAAVLSGCDVFRKTSKGKATAEAKALTQIVHAIEGLVAIHADLDRLSKQLVSKVAVNVSGHEGEINEFLRQCGYPYEVSIVSNPQASEAQMFLLPSQSISSASAIRVENPSDALSYGERNALALVLFMFEAIREPGALIVLDDPISSFDYEKRYGIMHALFSAEGLFSENLYGKTALVMTHDFLVVSDLICIPGEGVSKTRTKGQFLRCDSAGVLHTVPLGKDAIAPYTQLLRRRIRDARTGPEIIRLVLVRNLCEVLRSSPKDKRSRYGWAFRLLSDVIHGRDSDYVLTSHRLSGRDCREVRMCESCVRKISGVSFDFWKAVDTYAECAELLVDIYEKESLSSIDKLTIVRLLILRDCQLASSAMIMKRFADESCHIGGSYLYQIDGRVYDQVPFYVVAWCDDVVAMAKAKLNAK